MFSSSSLVVAQFVFDPMTTETKYMADRPLSETLQPFLLIMQKFLSLLFAFHINASTHLLWINISNKQIKPWIIKVVEHKWEDNILYIFEKPIFWLLMCRFCRTQNNYCYCMSLWESCSYVANNTPNTFNNLEQFFLHQSSLTTNSKCFLLHCDFNKNKYNVYEILSNSIIQRDIVRVLNFLNVTIV